MSEIRPKFEVVGFWARADGQLHESLPDKENDIIRIVAVSDTHGYHRRELPQGDILIHAGDFTNYGRANEIRAFTKWISAQSHPHKLVIAGNHEYSLDENSMKSHFQGNDETDAPDGETDSENLVENGPAAKRALLQSVCTYLENETIEVCGIKFYCSPINIGMGAFGFARGSSKLKEFWRAAPTDIDILITHGPPSGNRAVDRFGRDGGDENLREFVARSRQLVAHIFGHIHESYGVSVEDGVHFINAAVVHRAAAIVLDIRPLS